MAAQCSAPAAHGNWALPLQTTILSASCQISYTTQSPEHAVHATELYILQKSNNGGISHRLREGVCALKSHHASSCNFSVQELGVGGVEKKMGFWSYGGFWLGRELQKDLLGILKTECLKLCICADLSIYISTYECITAINRVLACFNLCFCVYLNVSIHVSVSVYISMYTCTWYVHVVEFLWWWVSLFPSRSKEHPCPHLKLVLFFIRCD